MKTKPRFVTIDTELFSEENGLIPVFNPATNSFQATQGAGDGSGLLILDGTAGTDITLTAAQSENGNIVVNGATAALNVIVYGTLQRAWRVYNNNSGSFAVTFKTSAGTGVAVAANASSFVECDGTNIVEIVTSDDDSSYELLTNKATDFTTLNDTLYPTTSAVQTAINSAVVGLYDFRGVYDASGNVYPSTGGSGAAGAILKGDVWKVSVTGTLNGESVAVGSDILAIIDSPGTTDANWSVLAASNSGGTWGSITGTLSDQTDLQTALDAKTAKASNLSDLANAATARTNLGLGTAATKDVPASGDASSTQVVLGNDTRLGGSGVFSAIASQAEAEAGTDNTKGMTPLRTAEAIAALATGGGGSVDDATIRFDIYRYRF